MNETRKAWMGTLAQAKPEALAEAVGALGALPGFTWMRRPEVGGVMVPGRMGGTGAAFNLGEITVTRCALKLESGEVGHAYVQGRNKAHAERAALCDALMQTGRAGDVRRLVLAPLAAARAKARKARAARAASTKVEFFTLVRGEDA